MFNIFEALKFLRKTFSRRDILILLVLLVLYLATRLIKLDQFPIFSDEGIYIHWAKVAWHDANWRFISLTDGKQPLQTWGTIPLLKFFPNNALLAGRLFAVSTGLTALVGMFTLLYYLFGKKAALWGSFFYIFTPYFLFYDRMALVDSGVNAGFIWILFFSVWLARTERLDVALLYGLVGGIAMLAKSSVRIFIGLSALAPILFFKRNKKFIGHAINYWFLYAVGGAIALAIYNIQRLSPFFHFVSEKNNTFVMTFAEFRATPFANFPHNIWIAPWYIFCELAFIIGFLGIAGLALMFRKDKRMFSYFFLWILLPYIVVAFLSKIVYPRYLIFFASTFTILAAYFMSLQKNIKVIAICLVLFVASVVYYDYTLIADYKNIPFPDVDRGQYLEGWPAGWGIKEISEFARQQSADKHVILVVQGNFGMSGDVLDVYRRPSDTYDIRGYWPLDKAALIENQKELANNKVFVVFSHTSDFPKDWPLKFIKKFDKPNNQSAIYLFELTK